LVFQFVVPLRPYLSAWQHNATQLDLNWSKEGYYFSWRERLVDEVNPEKKRKERRRKRQREKEKFEQVKNQPYCDHWL
jgi:hypothetical protein